MDMSEVGGQSTGPVPSTAAVPSMADFELLKTQLAALMDNQPSDAQHPAGQHAKHVPQTAGGHPRRSRDDEDDLLSIFAEESVVSGVSSPSRQVSYDPEADLEIFSTAQVNKNTGFDSDDELYGHGPEVLGKPVFDALSTRLTKAVTMPPKTECLEKLDKQYLTPANAPALCAPRVDEQLWASIPTKARAADSRAQKLQKAVVRGMIPYAHILAELHDAADDKRAVDVSRVKRLALDGITLAGHATYEISMKRREDLKPSFNPKYRGICSRTVPVGQTLFGGDLSATLKSVGDTYLVGQKIAPSVGRYRRRFGNLTSGRRPAFRPYDNYRDTRSGNRHGPPQRSFRHATISRPPPPRFRETAGQQRNARDDSSKN
ncbi:uncharacterized protein [Diadema setosum]|uniref:uncharacterized protein n=1 Tax=Diadema setosum TaxID=31175 RepID=UPI003B3BE37E